MLKHNLKVAIAQHIDKHEHLDYKTCYFYESLDMSYYLGYYITYIKVTHDKKIWYCSVLTIKGICGT